LEHRVPHGVPRLRLIGRVLAAVDLDNHAPGVADEVQDIAPERRLPADVEAPIAEQPQPRPQPRLLRRQLLAKMPRALDGHGLAPPDPFGTTLPMKGREDCSRQRGYYAVGRSAAM